MPAAADPAEPAQQVLRARKVGYEHAGRPVLRHLDFELRRGSTVACCGPRGAGKTTLVRLLAGEVGATRGRIEPAALHAAGTRRDVAVWSTRDATAYARDARANPAPTVVFDDALDGLDPAERHELWDAMRVLARDKAVVVTTREPAFAALADRVLLLAGGTIVADGPPAAVLQPALLHVVFGYDFTVVQHPSTRTIAVLTVG
jgi:ABC-type multidrug transport system ATPase subunit